MNREHSTLRAAVAALNTLGLIGYLGWLVFGHERILYTQAGILFLLPCLPFVFVFAFLFRGPRDEPDDDEGT
jgi:hypothetical protein